MMIAVYILIGILAGGGFAVALVRMQQKQLADAAREKANNITRDAKRKAEDIVKDSEKKSRDAVEQARRKMEQSYQTKVDEVRRSEQRAKDIERNLAEEKRAAQEAKERADAAALKAERIASEHERQTKAAIAAEEHFKQQLNEVRSQLERVAGMTQKEAREGLMLSIEDDAKLHAAKLVKQIEEQSKEDAEKLSKRIISIAISRYASEYIPERTTSMVSLPSDELKGRLIGREGRNIRALEQATGCDLIIDDTPETVIVSCFDPVRRHIGKTVLEALIQDGRIHPGRIEELVEKVTNSTNNKIKEAGEKALLELQIVSMHPELIKLIGQLQFRYSYSQNQYYHVIEVGHLCGLMAAELGLDIKKARRAGLLHDIGKALTHEMDGSHAVLGADMCEKYGEAPDIVHAVRAHHEDVKPESWLDFLVIGSDAMSGARPGARREQLDNYVRRLEDLERIANTFPGVERSFAIAAGRELRVMVENSRINDEHAVILSRDIAKKIEQDMTYPGQIKVTVIRETRATSLAK
ncbi:MAG: ribonuclease Y [Bdellovibrionales bacterium]|nr:ribonuclease Y [Bdellovibrionales bacterium]